MFFESRHCKFESIVANRLTQSDGWFRLSCIVWLVTLLLIVSGLPASTRAQEPTTSEKKGETPDAPVPSPPTKRSQESPIQSFDGNGKVIGQSNKVTRRSSDSPSETAILDWIHRLESDSYADRHLAYQLLQPHPEKAIKLVEKAIATAEQDAAHRLIRLLGGWSIYPDFGYGLEAFSALERVARSGVSVRAMFAKSVVQGIAADQAGRSETYLKSLGAYIDFSRLSLFGFQQTLGPANYYLLRLDDAYVGTVEDLRCLRWVSSVEIVRLEGERINREWLAHVVRLPNLRILQIRHTSINGKDIELLQSVEQLEGLEIMYSPIDDDAIDVLSNLPLANRMRLFGTQMSEEGIAKLREILDGSEIMFGRGGFLGISCDGQNLTLKSVNTGSGAEKAGLRVDDRIEKIDGLSLKTFDQLRGELAKHKPGEQVTIEFIRTVFSQSDEGEKSENFPHKVKVILGEQP
jgi:PDZ domain